MTQHLRAGVPLGELRAPLAGAARSAERSLVTTRGHIGRLLDRAQFALRRIEWVLEPDALERRAQAEVEAARRGDEPYSFTFTMTPARRQVIESAQRRPIL